MRRAVAVLLVGLITTAVAVTSASGSAGASRLGRPAAADPAAPTITWSVAPVPATDGAPRQRFEIAARPGEVVRDAISVHLIGTGPVTFSVYASDAFTDGSGRFDVLRADQRSTDVGAWIDLDRKKVTVPSDGTVTIPFTMRVPADASPGRHEGGIMTSLSTTVDAGRGSPLRVDRRVGTRVHLKVTGPVVGQVVVRNEKIDYSAPLSPIESGNATVSFTVTNTGNSRLQVRRSIGLSGWSVNAATTRRRLPELLPGTSLDVVQRFSGARTVGQLTADILVTGRTVGDRPIPLRVVATSASTFVVPWALVVVVVGLAAGAGIWLFRRRRGRPRTA